MQARRSASLLEGKGSEEVAGSLCAAGHACPLSDFEKIMRNRPENALDPGAHSATNYETSLNPVRRVGESVTSEGMKSKAVVFRNQRWIQSRWERDSNLRGLCDLGVRLPSAFPSSRARAFTLVELLVVIAIIGLLAAMVLPALSKGKAVALTTVCLNNTRQLQIAWYNYAQDSKDRLVPAGGWINTDIPPGYSLNRPGDLNEDIVTTGLLWPYVKSEGVYRCPAQTAVYAGTFLRAVPVDSFAISDSMNGASGSRDPVHNRLLTSIKTPAPVDAIVFVDENLYTIDFGEFGMPTAIADGMTRWADHVPAGRHPVAGGTLSFADGHSEVHHWVEPSTPAIIQWNPTNTFYEYPGANGGPNLDVVWMSNHSQRFYMTW